MILPTHVIVGAMIAKATVDPLVAVPVAVLSHPILDLFCIYHPQDLLRLDTWGKRILFGVGVLGLLAAILVIGWDIRAWFYGVILAWFGFDFQWVIRWMFGKDVFRIHQYFHRMEVPTHKMEFIAVEAAIMAYGLVTIWRLHLDKVW